MERLERTYSQHKNISFYRDKNNLKLQKNFDLIDKEYINKPQQISSFHTYKLHNPSISFRKSPQTKILNNSQITEYSRNIKIKLFDDNKSLRENVYNKISTSKTK
jgi:hypothetical protein